MDTSLVAYEGDSPKMSDVDMEPTNQWPSQLLVPGKMYRSPEGQEFIQSEDGLAFYYPPDFEKRFPRPKNAASSNAVLPVSCLDLHQAPATASIDGEVNPVCFVAEFPARLREFVPQVTASWKEAPHPHATRYYRYRTAILLDLLPTSQYCALEAFMRTVHRPSEQSRAIEWLDDLSAFDLYRLYFLLLKAVPLNEDEEDFLVDLLDVYRDKDNSTFTDVLDAYLPSIVTSLPYTSDGEVAFEKLPCSTQRIFFEKALFMARESEMDYVSRFPGGRIVLMLDEKLPIGAKFVSQGHTNPQFLDPVVTNYRIWPEEGSSEENSEEAIDDTSNEDDSDDVTQRARRPMKKKPKRLPPPRAQKPARPEYTPDLSPEEYAATWSFRTSQEKRNAYLAYFKDKSDPYEGLLDEVASPSLYRNANALQCGAFQLFLFWWKTEFLRRPIFRYEENMKKHDLLDGILTVEDLKGLDYVTSALKRLVNEIFAEEFRDRPQGRYPTARELHIVLTNERHVNTLATFIKSYLRYFNTMLFAFPDFRTVILNIHQTKFDLAYETTSYFKNHESRPEVQKQILDAYATIAEAAGALHFMECVPSLNTRRDVTTVEWDQLRAFGEKLRQKRSTKKAPQRKNKKRSAVTPSSPKAKTPSPASNKRQRVEHRQAMAPEISQGEIDAPPLVPPEPTDSMPTRNQHLGALETAFQQCVKQLVQVYSQDMVSSDLRHRELATQRIQALMTAKELVEQD